MTWWNTMKVPLSATLKTSNRLLQNIGTYMPDCMVSWPKQLWSKFSCCENLRSDDVCNSLWVAEKLLTFFVNCVMKAYPYFGSCKCHFFFTEIFYCGWSVHCVVYDTFISKKCYIITISTWSLYADKHWTNNSFFFTWEVKYYHFNHKLVILKYNFLLYTY